ncbi:PQQ-dependent sugar dehydrogenase [Asanoa sp. NPDC049518]|uniref:PQQ-dependent sugar dehydrogenase n=1 Tax=unclassified Asanoa TaxID=2685164 RepID=UPI0034381FB4
MRKKLALVVAPLLAVAGGGISLSPAAAAPPGGPPADSNFQKVTLNDFPGEPVSLAVLPDNRVLHTARTGEVRIHDPRSGRNILAADVPVYEHDEEGLQGVAIDPDFARNKWVYLYYSPVLDTPTDDPATPDVNEGDAPFEGTAADFAPFKGHLQLSRFKLEGNTLNLRSEQKIIQVNTDRGICCHVGGQIDFDSKGNLYLSTGDDSNPFFSDGYVPIDERANRNPAFDAQRTSANTNDLRGKVLRIRVKNGGGYTVPSGNLFKPGTAKTRPEIYAMGLRNPFRFAVDKRTDDVYVGDYSPDAGEPDPARGPAGQGRWLRIDKPANYGWPYCATDELPYVDYDFATGTSGAPFNCRRPVNESPHNTGLTRLPAVERPEVAYSYGPSAEFPELGEGGIGPMGGPAYEYDRRSDSRTKWPAYYDGVPLFYEWTRDYIKEFRLDRHGNVADIRPVLGSLVVDNPMDMEFGPDGALYVLEYGDGYFAENPDAQLSRFDFVRGNRTPVPVISGQPLAGDAPLTVQFSSAGTTDADGDALRYAWDFDADGTVDSRAANPTYTFAENGSYRVTLKVTDSTGRSASAELPFVVGPRPPTVTIVAPEEGQPFEFGDTVPFEVTVVDNEPTDCSRVTVNYILGHDEHGHPITSATGCSGSISTSAPGHGPGDDLSGVFVATYTDADGQVGTDQVVLFPGTTP